MRHKRLVSAVLTLLMSVNFVTAGNVKTRVYVYGFAASFNDSTVYFTDIQQIDTAWINTKTKFLLDRDNYSYQLKQYLQGLGVAHPTCITSFDFSRKAIEKKYLTFKKKYTKDHNYDIKYIASTDFQYEGVTPDDITLQQAEAKVKTKKATREDKKAAKQSKKAEKRALKAEKKTLKSEKKALQAEKKALKSESGKKAPKPKKKDKAEAQPEIIIPQSAPNTRKAEVTILPNGND